MLPLDISPLAFRVLNLSYYRENKALKLPVNEELFWSTCAATACLKKFLIPFISFLRYEAPPSKSISKSPYEVV